MMMMRRMTTMLITDCKRTGYLNRKPWGSGRNPVWDVMVSDTTATCCLFTNSVLDGANAKLVSVRKCAKYCLLMHTRTNHFVPLAFKTLKVLSMAQYQLLKTQRENQAASSNSSQLYSNQTL